jgi:hypothetical protein
MEASLQELIRRRAGNRCECCHIPQERDRLPFEIDHIIAESHEGTADYTNRCLCSSVCNRYKGPKIAEVDPKSKRITRMVNP